MASHLPASIVTAGVKVLKVYKQFFDAGEKVQKSIVVRRLLGPLSELSAALIESPSEVVSGLSEETLEAYFEFRTILCLQGPRARRRQSEEQGAGLQATATVKSEILRLASAGDPHTQKAAGLLVGYLLTGLGALRRDLREELLLLLASLTGRQEGVTTAVEPILPSAAETGMVPSLSKLLDLFLFSEVHAFLSTIRRMPPQSETLPFLRGVNATTVSIVSRKGGVGKSTLALAALMYFQRSGRSVCILDLDFTGPTWQYILPWHSLSATGSSPGTLNRLLNMDQPEDEFDFGTPSPQEILDTINTCQIDGSGFSFGLATMADLPRTNRLLTQVIANNRASYAKFLASVLSAIDSRYDTIVVDCAPGLDVPSLMALAVVNRMTRGFPIVVSTPLAADLSGTMLELADLRFLQGYSTPAWVINKVDPEAAGFLEELHHVPDLADRLPSYRGLLPEAPLLKRAIRRKPFARRVATLPFDELLARTPTVVGGESETADSLVRFLDSAFFRKASEFFQATTDRKQARSRRQT